MYHFILTVVGPYLLSCTYDQKIPFANNAIYQITLGEGKSFGAAIDPSSNCF